MQDRESLVISIVGILCLQCVREILRPEVIKQSMSENNSSCQFCCSVNSKEYEYTLCLVYSV